MDPRSKDSQLLRDAEDALLSIQRVALFYTACEQQDAPVVAMRSCLRIARESQRAMERLHERVTGDAEFENLATKAVIVQAQRVLDQLYPYDDDANADPGNEAR
jgi:hypothetical protein